MLCIVRTLFILHLNCAFKIVYYYLYIIYIIERKNKQTTTTKIILEQQKQQQKAKIGTATKPEVVPSKSNLSASVCVCRFWTLYGILITCMVYQLPTFLMNKQSFCLYKIILLLLRLLLLLLLHPSWMEQQVNPTLCAIKISSKDCFKVKC